MRTLRTLSPQSPQSPPPDEQGEHLVYFTDKRTGRDLIIDKSIKLDNNEDDEEGEVWYPVKLASTRKVIGRSNLQRIQEFADDSDEDDDDGEEEEDDDEEDEDD